MSKTRSSNEMPLTPPAESGAARTRVRGAREPEALARGERGDRPLGGGLRAVCMAGGRPRLGGAYGSNGIRAEEVDFGRGAVSEAEAVGEGPAFAPDSVGVADGRVADG